MLWDRCIFCSQKREGRIRFNVLWLEPTNLRTLLGGGYLTWNLAWNVPCNLPKICHAWKNIKKVTVSWNLRRAHLLRVGLAKIPGDHKTGLSIVRHVGLHVDFSSTKSSLGLQAVTFVCEVNLASLRPFNQWELVDCNGHWAFNVVCEVALRCGGSQGVGLDYGFKTSKGKDHIPCVCNYICNFICV